MSFQDRTTLKVICCLLIWFRRNMLGLCSRTYHGKIFDFYFIVSYYPQTLRIGLLTIFEAMASGAKIKREFQTINNVTYSVMPRDGFSTTDSKLPLARMCDTAFPTIWHLQETVTQLTAHPTNLKTYHFLAQAVYILSNDLIVYGDHRAVKLTKALFIDLPRGMLSTLFQRDLPSIESAYEKLFRMAEYAHSDRRKTNEMIWSRVDLNDVIYFLICVGLQHPYWPAAGKDNLAFAAISISNSHLLQQLLQLGACPMNSSIRSYAIWKAIRMDSISCVQALVEDCDLNFRFEGSRTHFTIICAKMQRTYDRNYLGVFNILLEAGADVNSLFPLRREYSHLLEEMETSREWYPTCLDWGFQKDGKLFDLMLLRSSSTDGRLTRHGVLRAAMHGKSALSAYLRSRDSLLDGQTKNFLELVMREQLLMFEGCEFFNVSALKTLIDFEVQIHTSDYPEYCSRLLRDARRGISNETYELLGRFFQDCPSVSAEAISEAVSEEGTTLLEFLSKLSIEIGDIGLHALLRAARIGNFGAVNWLLGAGVNIKGGIRADSGSEGDFTIVTLLIQEIDSHQNIKTKMSMLQHLVDCGAELKERPRDQYADGLLQHVLVQRTKEIRGVRGIEGDHDIVTVIDQKKTAEVLVPWLLDQLGVGSRRIAGAELQALFAAASTHSRNSRLILNRLYTSYGLPPCPEAVLAILILSTNRQNRQAGEDELIQDVIQKSASIDMYAKAEGYDCWYTPLQAAASVCNGPLVLQLLDHGADINAPPRGFNGSTALQAICLWYPLSGEERNLQQKLVNLLVKNGANINAEHEAGGWTALMASAIRGDVELAAVLLAHGADPNLHVTRRFETEPESTLDVSTGRCDMTKLLLDAGALSARRGTTGYEGAILYAEIRGNHAVVRILKGHIEQQEKQFRIRPELRVCHDALMKKMDKQDAERREKSLQHED